MPWDALPEHLNSPKKWDGKDDDDHSYTKWRKQIKGWLAYSFRSRHWWARWRKLPIVLVALFGEGESRWELDGVIMAVRSINTPVFFYSFKQIYLSRIQYWCSWSVQLQWPLFFACHFKYRKKGLIYFYIGAKRDGDRVYWFPALFLGTTFK